MNNKLNVVPIHDRVIVKPSSIDDVSSGGVIIPHLAKEKPNRGVVVAVGSGVGEIKMTTKIGDEVLYSKNAGLSIVIDDAEYLIMKESDLLAII